MIIDFYSKNQLSQAGFLEPPVYIGFVIKDLEKEQSHYQILNNERYGKYNLQKSVLQPVKTGKVKIKKYAFRVNYINEYGSFDTKDFNTKEAEINVLPLPEPKPDNFKDIVGKLSITKSQAKNKINFGDSLTIKIKLFGECNLDSVEKIYPDSLNGVKVYQTVKNKKEEIQNGKYYTEKEIDIVFIPEISGKINIPELNLFYFNTEKNTYESIKIDSFDIIVSGDVKEATPFVNNLKEINKDEKKQADKISLIENDENMENKFKKIKIAVYYIIIIIIAIAIIILIILKIKPYIKRKIALEREIELKYSINFKTDSKEEIIKKIGNNSLGEKIISLIEEREKERLGFEYNRDKIEINLKTIQEILKKNKKKGN
jgi:hypothetical protein